MNRKGEEAEQQPETDEDGQGGLRQQQPEVHLEQNEEAQGDAECPDQAPARALGRFAQPPASGQIPISR